MSTEVTETTDVLQFRDVNQPSFHIVFWKRNPAPATSTPTVLLWIHGMGEHSGRYKHMAHELLNRVPQLSGVASFDLRGHGQSTGERGSCSTLDAYVNDFKEHVSVRMGMEFGQGVRCVIGGHSMGGIVATECLARGDWLKEEGFGEVVGGMLSAPAVECVVPGVVNRVLAGMAGVLVRVPGVRGVVKENGIDKRKLTHCEEAIESMENDEHMHSRVGLGVGADLLKRGNELLERMKAATVEDCLVKRVPLMVVHGELDEVTTVSGSRRLVEAAGDNAELVVVGKAFHEMHNEDEEHGREQFLQTTAGFLQKVAL